MWWARIWWLMGWDLVDVRSVRSVLDGSGDSLVLYIAGSGSGGFWVGSCFDVRCCCFVYSGSVWNSGGSGAGFWFDARCCA